MKENVKKRAPTDKKDLILSNVTYLHESVSESEFIERKNFALNKWSSEVLDDFVEYLSLQWLSPPFEK